MYQKIYLIIILFICIKVKDSIGDSYEKYEKIMNV